MVDGGGAKETETAEGNMPTRATSYKEPVLLLQRQRR